MTVPVAEFEDFDSPITGLDDLADGVAADVDQGGVAVLLPALVHRPEARRREGVACVAKPLAEAA